MMKTHEPDGTPVYQGNSFTPTVGRIVNYTLTEDDAKSGLGNNGVNAGDKLPAVIVRTWGSTSESAVNLRVLTDGPDAPIWKTSVLPGDEQGRWNWPPRS
jgi:hypothetical protein